MFAPTCRPWLFAWSSCSTRISVAERGDREAGDVAGREHVLAPADAAEGVDDDAVRDRQAGVGGELDVRLDPDSGDDRVRLERPPVAERDVAPSLVPSIPVTEAPASTSTPRSR